MRCTNSIYICHLHKIKILNVSFLRYIPAVIHIKVVTINASEHQRHTVEQNLFTDNFNLFETDFIGLNGYNIALIVKNLHNKAIEIRCFCRPFFRIFNVIFDTQNNIVICGNLCTYIIKFDYFIGVADKIRFNSNGGILINSVIDIKIKR